MSALRYLVLIAVTGTGCDRVFGLEGREPGVIDAAPLPDSALGPWRPAQLLTTTAANGTIQTDPSLTADGLELIYSDSTGALDAADIYVAKRLTTETDFGVPVLVPELSTVYDDFGYLSADGLSAYINHGGDGEIYRASRATRNDPFGPSVVDAGLSSPSYELNPALSGDGLQAVVDRVDPTAARELFLFSRTDVDAAWQTPRRVEGVSTTGLEGAGSLDERGLTLVFYTTRETGLGDLFISTRDSVDDVFSFSRTNPLVELNTPAHEADPHISPDLRTLVFNRDGRLYISTR
jgi:hypothetical protein